MSGRPPAPRTRFARLDCGDPEVVTFKISGSLGPRAKPMLVRLTQECLRRNLPRVVLDLSEVDALGGGTARLLNQFAAERGGRGGRTAFRVTSRTVRGFLCADPHLPPPPLAASLDEAVALVREAGTAAAARAPAAARPRFDAPRATTLLLHEDTDSDAVDESLLRDATPLDATDGRNPGDPFAAPLAAPGLEHATTWDEWRERLTATLHERGIAARTFVFQLDGDGSFYLATRQGVDRERALPGAGAVVRALGARGAPTFLIDLEDSDASHDEVELLAELNCEVAAAIGGGSQRALVFLSKEQPGEEYRLEELQDLESVLEVAAAAIARLRSVPAPRAGRVPAFGFEPEAPALPELEVVEPEDDVAGMDAFSPWSTPIVTPERTAQVESLVATARGRGVVRVPAEPAAPPSSVAAAGRGPETGDATRPLRRTVTQLRDILRFSHDFDAAFGTSRLLDVLVLSVVSVARAETVLYFALRDGEFRLTHHRGLAPDAIQGLRLRGDSTLVQATLGSQRGLSLADAASITEEERIWARQHGLTHAAPFRFKDEVLGVLLLGAPADAATPDLEMLHSLLAQAGMAYDRARLYETLQDRTLGVVRGLITLIESRNGFDCGSTEQVVRYVQALGRELQYPAEQRRDLVYGAVLRDVGMLKVSETLLRSAQDLTADQWESIRRHPQEGASIMRQMRFSETAIDVVLHHHEAYNGEGYPMGLRGRAIPLGARIVAVAESYVKMIMDRPYRKALGKAEALESLAENWGLRYDPLVVDALVRVVNRELSLGLRGGEGDLARDLFGV